MAQEGALSVIVKLRVIFGNIRFKHEDTTLGHTYRTLSSAAWSTCCCAATTVVAAFNQEKALVGAFSVIMNLRMDLFEALERNDGGSLHASIIHHWTRKILCSSGENGEECFQCLLWSNNDSCDSRGKIDNGGMTPGKWSCHVCID